VPDIRNSLSWMLRIASFFVVFFVECFWGLARYSIFYLSSFAKTKKQYAVIFEEAKTSQRKNSKEKRLNRETRRIKPHSISHFWWRRKSNRGKKGSTFGIVSYHCLLNRSNPTGSNGIEFSTGDRSLRKGVDLVCDIFHGGLSSNRTEVVQGPKTQMWYFHPHCSMLFPTVRFNKTK